MFNKDVKFSLKVVINRQKTKVLFAEADSKFADILLSFLTLPLGRIVRVLENHYGDEAPVIGSLTTLYNGLCNLDIANFWTEGGKQMLLDPISSFGDINNDAQATKFFCCEDWDCRYSTRWNISMYYGIARCGCGKALVREVPMRNVSDDDDDDDGGVFTVNTATFIISDDLLILPNVAGSVIQILGNLGITDTCLGEILGEIKNVTFGFNEIMDLLKGSFISRTPLTDTVLNKGLMINSVEKPSDDQPGILLPNNKVEKKRICSNPEKMVLKVILQKSTNKLLFAQAEEKFIDFLFSLLTIPLGRVECLLNGGTCLKNIDNLYKSVVDLIDEKYLESGYKDSLTDPKPPHGYIREYQILFLEQENAPSKIYYYPGHGPDDDFVSLTQNMRGTCVKVTSFKFQKQSSYVKGPRMYMVNDDLSVTPSCVTSYLSNLNGLKTPLSDVTELVLHVGLEEALSILKASLVSKSALSNVLNPLLIKQPKQEK